MRILRVLFKCDVEFTPLSLLHFSPLDLHREVFLAHSIYHHIKHEHLECASNIKNFVDIQGIKIAIDYGKALLEHEFPRLFKDLYQTPEALPLVVSS